MVLRLLVFKFRTREAPFFRVKDVFNFKKIDFDASCIVRKDSIS